MLEKVAKGADPAEVAGDAMGFRKFVSQSVHRCPHHEHDGKPQDADKTAFDQFIATFGLPAGHAAVTAAQKAMQQGSVGWASEAFKMAKALSKEVLISHEQAEALKLASRAKEGVNEKKMYEIFLAVGRIHVLAKKAGGCTGQEENCIALAELEEEISEESVQLTVNKLKEDIDKIMEQDRRLAEDCEKNPKLGGKGALLHADKIQACLSKALTNGVDRMHDYVREARTNIIDLKAEAISRDAKCMIFTSDQEYQKKGWIEDAATKCANAVEKMIQDATEKDGIPNSHPALTAAYKASKELREQEGFRKREFNAAKRRAQQ